MVTTSTIDDIEDTTILRMLRKLADKIDESGLNPEEINNLKISVNNLIYYVGKDSDLIPNYPFN